MVVHEIKVLNSIYLKLFGTKSEGFCTRIPMIGEMKEILISLLQKNRNNNFLKNKIEIRCKCGYSEKLSYYDFLTGGEFNIGQPMSTISPFISETIYDETIQITPLILSKKCPVCGEEISAIFPLSLENLISLLQSQPPDPQMYG